MRGASALEKLLAEVPDAPLRVFVVWEPVLWSDIAPPTSGVLGLLPDARAVQYWDAGRALSREILEAVNHAPARFGREQRLPEDFIVWDAVAVFSTGALWEERFPVPAYYGGPVVQVIEDTRSALAAELKREAPAAGTDSFEAPRVR